ncbi:hypothetical protein MYP_2005 [Sporocytophaga myxococcoides]|uniref:Thioredoxin domain-containing protein n=1 Tax=Sporocytophaga myxococcoides TaxID=153721 RepID=A0A098LED2_9BACT|nr:thioredoxin fold domain-containing protein [Sporocytophaga myxococcoides]GAL84777.1 hypothetical protein MYP_2005 [Sporocytophaga myxococcoides]
MRKGLIIFIVTFCFLAICALLWKEYFRYSLPTSVPSNYKFVNAGLYTSLFKEYKDPILLHFFNPKCPCSKFNSSYIQSLHRRYKDRITFFAVVEQAHIKDYKDQFDFKLITDDGSIADTFGVYATPQAVILKDGKLIYRGNYNKARFCTDKDTYFPEIILDSLLNNKQLPNMPSAASQAYGCNLNSDLNFITTP